MAGSILNNTTTVEFTLKVEGSANTDGYKVISFHTDNTVNKIPFADIFIEDGDVAKQEFAQSNGDDFLPGKTITLEVGNINIQPPLFKGIIISQRIRQNNDGTFLQLKVKDVAVRMTVGRKNAYFYNQTDSQIISKLLADYGLSSEVEDVISPDITTPVHAEMVQYYCTDWDFIVTRAEASGRVVAIENGHVSVKAPKVLPQNPTNYDVEFGGENTHGIDAEMNACDEYNSVTANAWNYEARTPSTESSRNVQNFASEGDLTPQFLADEVIKLESFLLQHGGSLTNEELKLWSYSKLLRSRLAKIRGTARVSGTNQPKIGGNINIIRFTERFNGPAFVSGVRHELTGNSTWYTDIQFGYSQEWFAEKYPDINDQPASGLLPAVQGLMIGIVTEIDTATDPENNHRVRVRIPLVSTSQAGVWARVSALDAGEKRGVFFRPEIGDEVILGFLDNDPRQPIVLGSLFSKSNATPPFEIASKSEDAKSKYFKQGIFTHNGLKIVFDDDKETILISTKDDKNKIFIDAKNQPAFTIMDAKENKIEMSDKGITIESASDLILKAEKDIKVNGKTLDIAIEESLKSNSTGTSEYTSGSSMTISGSITKIN